ncbi:MAG TPA: sugar phosphate isomerase/epimerase [Terriglobales bacterium]|nr:sugar phosphate isomerase/epimerase [Terriglobales bacterium]
MGFKVSRREFIGSLGIAAAATVASSIPAYKAISAAPPDIRIGYAAITWGDKERQAIDDISSLGYRGIQLRANAIRDFQSAELRDLLQQHQLTMVALSSGEVHVDPALEAQDIALHAANAKFLHDVGGLYLQVLDQEPKSQAITAADYKQLGRLITEIGKRTADLGITLGYHNHMNSVSERPEGLDRLMDSSDPRYVKLEMDIAHYQAGGGDPAKVIEKYRDRLLFLHIKDLGEPGPNSADPRNAENFLELGRGKVDLPAVFAALHKIKFRGWAVVELDHEPDKSRTPKESALISKKYLEERLGLTV